MGLSYDAEMASTDFYLNLIEVVDLMHEYYLSLEMWQYLTEFSMCGLVVGQSSMHLKKKNIDIVKRLIDAEARH